MNKNNKNINNNNNNNLNISAPRNDERDSPSSRCFRPKVKGAFITELSLLLYGKGNRGRYPYESESDMILGNQLNFYRIFTEFSNGSAPFFKISSLG